jgi:ankyrin repeat protein
MLGIYNINTLQGFKAEIIDTQESEVDIDGAGSSNQAGWTPLMYSAYLGHIETTQRLLDLKVDVEQRNLLGQTALMLAATCGKEQMV